MYILDTSKHRNIKTTIIYVIITIICVVINYVYSFFGHGVSSDSMTYMFLYPLIGGVAVFGLCAMFNIKAKSRIAYNLYNSGIAALTVGSMLKGVFDIAGTSSGYLAIYTFGGGALCLIGIVGFAFSAFKSNTKSRHSQGAN